LGFVSGLQPVFGILATLEQGVALPYVVAGLQPVF